MPKQKFFTYVSLFALILAGACFIFVQAYISFISEAEALYRGWPTPYRIRDIGVSVCAFSLLLAVICTVRAIYKRERSTIICELCTSCIIFLFIGVIHRPYGSTPEKYRRMSCQHNLKQLHLALTEYADNNNGFYPPHPGAKGLNLLWPAYLKSDLLFHCPSVRNPTRATEQSLQEKHISYYYIGGLDTSSSSDSPLLCDKADNHKYYGNVLYVDGTVKGYYGKPWYRRLPLNLD